MKRKIRFAKAAGLIAGACRQASTGCGSAEDRNIVDAVAGHGLALLDDLDHHAGIEPFLRAGYGVIVV